MEEILTQGESCQLSNWKIGESLALGIEMARWHNNSITSTLPETNIAMENPHSGWYLPGKMRIFMGYVSFREGKIY